MVFTAYSANIPISNNIAENLFNIVDTLNAVAKDSNDGAANVVVCFAECSLTGYELEGVNSAIENEQTIPSAIGIIRAHCKKLKVACVFGTPIKCPDGVVENVAICVDENGEVANIQSKLQLVPTDSFARPGSQLFTFKLFDTVCSTIICHDVRHAELVRLPVLKGARGTKHGEERIDKL